MRYTLCGLEERGRFHKGDTLEVNLEDGVLGTGDISFKLKDQIRSVLGLGKAVAQSRARVLARGGRDEST